MTIATEGRPKIPQALSPGEEEFSLQCRAYGYMPEREYRFSDTRRWRFDFAWPDRRIAVEIEGGTKFGMSKHSRGDGYVNDCRKYNQAALLGWDVFRFTTQMVLSGEAIDTLLPVLGRTS